MIYRLPRCPFALLRASRHGAGKPSKAKEEAEVSPEEIEELVKLYKKAKKLLEERLAEEEDPHPDLPTGDMFILFKLSALDDKLSRLDNKLSHLDGKLSYLLGIAGIVGALVIACCIGGRSVRVGL